MFPEVDSTVPVPALLMYAQTFVAIRFSENAPAALTPVPLVPPPATATDPASTAEEMEGVALAVSASALRAVMLEFRIYVSTSEGAAAGSVAGVQSNVLL